MGIIARVSRGALVFLFAWVLWTRTVTLTAPPGDPARLSIPNLWELDSAYTFRATCLVVATAKTMFDSSVLRIRIRLTSSKRGASRKV